MDIQFGYWSTTLGGLVKSKLPQRTDWTFEFNTQIAQVAETLGFDYILVAARFISNYGKSNQLDALSTVAALSILTKQIKLIAAVHSGLWHPGAIAKQTSTIDYISGGRFCINVLSGWYRQEFHTYGEPWLDHDERYRRSEEFIQVLKGLWTEDNFNFRGDFYRIHEGWLRPRPLSQPYPEIFQGGNSKAARRMAARYSDWYFMNGNSLEEVQQQIEEISILAKDYGRRLKFGLNAFIIVRDSEAEAYAELERIIAHADVESVNAFAEQVQQAGASTQDRIGMWANSDFANLVQPNDGFKTGLIGTAEQVAEKIRAYHAIGVDMILCAFLHYADELAAFGRTVIPLVRQLESERSPTLLDPVV